MKRSSRLVVWSLVALLALALGAGPALCAEQLIVGFVFSMTGGAAAYGAS